MTNTTVDRAGVPGERAEPVPRRRTAHDRYREPTTGLVAIVVPELENPLLIHLASQMAHALLRQGLLSVLCPEGAAQEWQEQWHEQLPGRLRARGISGVVHIGPVWNREEKGPEGGVAACRGAPMFVVHAGAEDSVGLELCTDDVVAAERTLGYLSGLGHTAIGLVLAHTGHRATGDRAETFLGRGPVLVQQTISSPEGGYAAAGALLDAGCTAVVCDNGLLALGVLDAVRGRGLTVPGDVSLMALEDAPSNRFTDPALTVLQLPVRRMAESAAAALKEALLGVPVPRAELVYAPELVVRGSTGPAPRGGRAC
ncbi:substrate-binding domain-containing protein [Streptomyces sp. NPDC001389]|uniref:substrate-binding domain-containing protein n=1 Tax=unclassified Streptomyces TaxID=2593676 RepID=UPI0036925328